MILTPENEEQIRGVFRSIHDTKAEIKTLNADITDSVNALADSLKVEPSEVRDAYKYWVKAVLKKKGTVATVDTLVSAVVKA